MKMLQRFTEKQLEEEVMKEVKCIINNGITMSKPGSIKYLLYGSEPSRQAICIKLGRIGEMIVKLIISNSEHLELLQCGVQCIDNNGKNKDIDLLWRDEKKKIIYYREAKGNIELDSEKLIATIEKVKEIINTHIKSKYSEYTIDFGVLNWSVYDRKELNKGISHIKTCEKRGVKVDHMGDILKLLEFEWSKEQYYEFFSKIGTCIDSMFT